MEINKRGRAWREREAVKIGIPTGGTSKLFRHQIFFADVLLPPSIYPIVAFTASTFAHYTCQITLNSATLAQNNGSTE